ncbi:NAD-dependent epimerase/dehydratase family protein [Rhodococcus sp. IEGM 1408]|uniref:NAD-dependent epimerase/dehydratase family protein n=1 Tax=Rhodococcus sp. IEGM 1408 TaxID=3082220 RepID=UPI0029540A63|nr:NAD-dependent epimerase/dehydratase family protein [Rhodococcus sp. IEGM 1408]MDV8001545.1 NAD-dependent epimerase/dehydratase family protein [Rhodococcus sp. IEGM 1408]
MNSEAPVRQSTRPARAVAVVGGSRYLGAHLVGMLLRSESVERVLAIDSVKPSPQHRRRMRDAEFVRLDPQSPRLQGILRDAGIDTVVHAGLHHTDFAAGGRAAVKESNIMGSMHVIAACGRAASVKRFVLISSTTVYGSSGADPAMFTEDMAARRQPSGGIPMDHLSVEGYVRAMSRKRPDIDVTILRVPAILGLPEPTVFGELLAPSIAPVLAGYDPRIQLLHPQDALDALLHASMGATPGTYNIAAEGILTLTQAIRRAGHVPLPVPAPTFRMVSRLLSSQGFRDIGQAQLRFLRFGRAMDTTRMRTEFGFTPQYTTEEALQSYLVDSGTEPLVTRASLERRMAGFAAMLPGPVARGLRAGIHTTLDELESLGALPDPIEEDAL